MIINCDVWLPLALSQQLGQIPLPMRVWFLWHYANARQIADSRLAMDTFPVEGM